MAAMSRMLPLVAFSTFAIFLLALLATPTNALSNVGGHPHHSRGHDSIAKRKRSPMKRAKRCRPQNSTLPAAATTSATTSYAAPASTEAADPQTTAEPSTTKAPESTKPATTSAAAATTSASGGGGGGSVNSSKKLLLAWPNGPTDLEKYTGSRVAGMYTWSPYKPSNADSLGIPFFPMLWGTKQKSVFPGQVDPLSTPTMIFGFNEPNQGDQANMSAKDGATLWNSMIRPYADKGWKLVSPACTSAPSGKTWIQDMQAACGGSCGFDYIALHWYGTKVDEFKKYVEDFWTTFGIPLIISEYACQNFSGGAQCSKSETEAFHYTMGAWFDQHPGVAMYAPFGFMHDMYNVNYDNQLMASDGSPTAVGRWYLDH